ncbi:methyl-CpG-binding domain protein 6 [Gavia stellata]|uniref:methyl-CpG-binding domain protein 6 n=1 Tax=Gavia stellata TaxID=37040 RepID=UPI0028A0A4A4|nr:methyl-CpG-binding domain protein 6 [Gavia stellata]
MSSGDDCTGTDRPTCPSAGPVPVGWERKVEEGSVCYISPSGTALTSLEQTCAYLLADGTCKCGLECPLNMHKVFNFDPGAAVAGRGVPGVQGQQDMTKLCNHRRKTAAMATLYRSMEGAPGPCHPATGPSLSPLFSAEGHLAMAPSTGVPLPSTVCSFPRVPLRAKILEATSDPTGTWHVAPPFLQPHDVISGANGSPKSCPPASPCFGFCLPPPEVVTPSRSPVVPLARGTLSQHPTGRTSSRAALSHGGPGESPEPGGPGSCLLATTSAPRAGKIDSLVSDALTSQSSNNPPVPLDAVPEGRGFLGLLSASTPFPASSLLSLAAKAQLGSPNPTPTPSTLPLCPRSPGTLLSLVGAAASPGVPKGAVAPGASSNGEGGAGGALGCPLPPATKPVAFVGQEQALALGGSLSPGFLLGTLPFSVALGQHPPAYGGDPEGPSLPSLLAASLLPLPTLDLLPSPGTLLSTLLPLPPGPGERAPEAPAPGSEGCTALPDWPLLFSTLPASLALHPTLLATGLGPLEPAPAAPSMCRVGCVFNPGEEEGVYLSAVQ